MRRRVLVGSVAAAFAVLAGWTLFRAQSPLVAAPASVVSADEEGDAVQRALARGKAVVAEFGANACAACREMKPVLETLRLEHGERIEAVDVDLLADRRAGYLQRYRIQLMPTQVFYDAQGREIGRHMGTIGADEILARLGVDAAEPRP
ncbi:TlpA family protein disulfide reductase [Azohydromonas sediminis]|uniref:TlpA family protein disulfide reductase n=1 Tax=Azohydromonas sediminis TaxID=2259674 RepID=UPI000E65DDD4|nr:thioredoxin family protein [Azohydromonas sediminis]